mmetsp:Transcript_20297/g.22670  ORF Transcript_20297/g.22670 Transcript_20297/m.22670 type:complete len:138 (-) Transcript_20297:293-706(-)
MKSSTCGRQEYLITANYNATINKQIEANDVCIAKVKNNYTETISVKLDNFSSHDSSIGFYIKQKGKFYFDYKTISAENKENMEIILEPSQEIYILMYTEDIEGNINVEANFASFKSKESRDLISSVIMISLPLLVII